MVSSIIRCSRISIPTATRHRSTRRRNIVFHSAARSRTFSYQTLCIAIISQCTGLNRCCHGSSCRCNISRRTRLVTRRCKGIVVFARSAQREAADGNGLTSTDIGIGKGACSRDGQSITTHNAREDCASGNQRGRRIAIVDLVAGSDAAGDCHRFLVNRYVGNLSGSHVAVIVITRQLVPHRVSSSCVFASWYGRAIGAILSGRVCYRTVAGRA